MPDFKRMLADLQTFRAAKARIQHDFINTQKYNIQDMWDYVASLDDHTKTELIKHYIDVLGREKEKRETE